MKNHHPVLRSASVFAGATLAVALASPPAMAHWCDDLWASSYNIAAKPETSTVTIPASGSGTLNVYVQNNMSWPLPKFEFSAKMTGGQVTVKMDDKLNKEGSFMPGETLKFVLTITKTGGGDVKAEDIQYSAKFAPGQGGPYPCTANGSVAAVYPDGTTGSTKGVGCGGGQALDIGYASLADFDTDAGIQKLMSLYCSGRGSYGSPANCSGTTTKCPTGKASGGGSKMDHPHLNACIELAARKAALKDNLPVVRARFMCGVAADNDPTWGGLPLFALGYLGDDPEARKFMKGLVDSATFGLIAKAALYVAGNPEDKTAYAADVKAGLTAGSFHGKMACAAALGIADKDDAAVKTVLMPATGWIYPESDQKGLYANHLLELVAWDRRGWAPKANDRCGVSFYDDPAFPGGCSKPVIVPDAGVDTVVGGGPGLDSGADTSTSSGGTTGGGGAAGSGGSSAKGGASGGRGGSAGAGGSGGRSSSTTGTGGSPNVSPGSASSSCNVGRQGQSSPIFYGLAFLAIWGVLGRRRR